MPRAHAPQIVTANHLTQGDVIYLTASGDWTRDLQQAQVHTDPDTATAALARATAQAHIAVGAYLAEVAVDDGRITATHFREAFRNTGPSNYFHGKQTETSHV